MERKPVKFNPFQDTENKIVVWQYNKVQEWDLNSKFLGFIPHSKVEVYISLDSSTILLKYKDQIVACIDKNTNSLYDFFDLLGMYSSRTSYYLEEFFRLYSSSFISVSYKYSFRRLYV